MHREFVKKQFNILLLKSTSLTQIYLMTTQFTILLQICLILYIPANVLPSNVE